MNNSTFLNVLNCFNELIHAETHLSFFQLVGFDVIKKLSSFDLLHDNVHVFLSFIRFPHLHNVLVTY
jgi:hypothetical protein